MAGKEADDDELLPEIRTLTYPSGVIDCVAFSVFEPIELLPARSIETDGLVRGDAARQAVIARRADLMVRPEDYRPDMEVAVFRPTGDYLRQLEKSRVPSGAICHVQPAKT